MASLVTTTVAGTASITATTNDGSTAPLTVTQAGTARAAYVTRNVASATRAMADFGQLSASGGAHPALHIQQTTTASDALRITSDGSTAKFAVTGTGAMTGTTAAFEASGLAINLNTPSASQNCWVTWQDNGANKWEIGKNTANKLYIHNYAAGASALEFDAASHATFGGQVTFTDDLYITTDQNIHWSGNYSFISGNGANTTGNLRFYTSDTLRLTIAGNGDSTFNPTNNVVVAKAALNASALTSTTCKLIGVKLSYSGGSNTANDIIGGISMGNSGEEYAGIYAIDGGSAAQTDLALFTGSNTNGIKVGLKIEGLYGHITAPGGYISTGVSGTALNLGDDSRVISIAYSNEIWNNNDDNSAQTLHINHRGYAGGTTQFRSLKVRNGKGADIAFFDGTNKATTLSGALTGTSATFSSGLYANGRLYLPNGSVSAPSLSFVNDGDTGMYMGASVSLRFAQGGSDALVIADGGAATFSGALAAGSGSFAGHVTPASNISYNLGSSGARWLGIYGNTANFSGALTGTSATFSGLFKYTNSPSGNNTGDLKIIPSANASGGVGYATQIIGVNIADALSNNLPKQFSTWGGVTGSAAIAINADDNSYGQFIVLTAPQSSSANTELTPRFWITGAGDAKFSGTLTANSTIQVSRSGASPLFQATDADAGGGAKSRWFGLVDGTSRFAIYGTNGSTEEFKLDDGGSATFSGALTAGGAITSADFFKATGNNLKFSAGGTHVFNVDVNKNIYPQTHNTTDLGFSAALAFRQLYIGNVYASGDSTFGGALTVLGVTAVGSYTTASQIQFRAPNNGISFINFYDNNSTEGCYIKSTGQTYGGKIHFGARWDDHEDKIVFDLAQSSASAGYDVKVGIGTATPAGLLSLANETRTLDVKLKTSPATGDMGVQFRAGSGDYLGLAAGGGTGIGIVIDDSNKVGIGTSAPSGLLDLYEPASGDNKLRFHSATTGTGTSNGSRIGLNGSELFINNLESSTIKIYTQSTQTNGICIANDGKVGIGTAIPLDKLHVQGNILQLDGSPEYHFGTTSTDHRNWRVACQEDVSQGFEIASGTTSAGTGAPSDTYTNRFVIKGATGQIQFNSYGGGTHTGTSAYKLSVDASGNIIETSIGSGAVDGSGTTNYISKWTDSDTLGNSSIFDNGTSVGIGTSSPTGKVQIDGLTAARFLTLNAPTDGGYITFETANTAFADIGAAKAISGIATYSTTDLMINARSGGKNIVFGMNGYEKVRIDSNGKVGIGTPTPGLKLEVKTSGSASTQYALSLTNPNNQAGDGGGAGIRFSTSSGPSGAGNEANKYSSIEAFDVNNWGSNSGLSFTTSLSYTKTKSMVIDRNGNVGIGRTIPSTKLVIQGVYDATATPSAVYGNAANKGIEIICEKNGSWPSGYTYGIDFGAVASLDGTSHYKIAAIYSAVESVPHQVAGQLKFYTTTGANGSTLEERMIIKADGHVGIGTDDPAYILDVYETISNIAIFRSTVTNYARVIIRSGSAGDAQVAFQNNTSTKWSIGNDGGDSDKFKIAVGSGAFAATEAFTITTSGSVGIGIGAPSQLLHVNGGSDYNARFTSASTRSGLVIDKPGTTTIMGSAMVLADETFKLGTASHYHVIMYQGGATYLLNQGSTKLATTSTGVAITGYASMTTGSASGKFAVMSSSVHASYDFYNNGTTYLNGTTTLDADTTVGGALTIASSGAVDLLVIKDTLNTGNASTPYVRFKDSGNNNLGYFGYGSGSNSDFYWDNSGGGDFRINGGDVILAGALTGTSATFSGDVKAAQFYTNYDWTTRSGGLNIGSQGITTGAVTFYDGVLASSASIYRDSSSVFFVGARGGVATTGMAIDTNGNVGIGDSTPNYKLDVNGTGRFTGTLTAAGATFNGVVLPSADSTYNLGDNTTRWATIFADTFYGNGANITSLTGSNISSGTVAAARLGSGSLITSKFLRGDNTWQTVSSGSGDITEVIAGTTLSGGGASGSVTINHASHTGEVTGSGSLTIAGNVVDEANLKVSNSPTNGYVLTARSGNTGGMTWEAASGGGGDTVSITTSADDILSVSSGAISGVDAGSSDKIVFWDNSQNKLTYLAASTGLYTSGTNLKVTSAVLMSIQDPNYNYCTPSSNTAGFYQGGSITVVASGNGVTFSDSTSSDYRLKSNILTFNSEAWTKVKSVNLRRFDFDESLINPNSSSIIDTVGFIAHELAEAGIEGAVEGAKDEVDSDGNPVYQKVCLVKLVPVMWGALKEAITKIETLETKVQTLENS